MFETKVVQKMKTHILCSITSYQKSCCLWCNMEKYYTARQVIDDNIIWHIHIACWIPKARNTLSEYVILTATAVTRMCLNFMLHVHCLSCFLLMCHFGWARWDR